MPVIGERLLFIFLSPQWLVLSIYKKLLTLPLGLRDNKKRQVFYLLICEIVFV